MNKLKSIWRKRDEASLTAGIKILITLALSLCTGIGMSVLMSFIRQQSVTGTWAFILEGPGLTLWTALFISLLTAALAFLTRSVFAGGVIVTISALILILTNHFKLLITSIPLQFNDLFLAFQVGDIAQLNSSSIVFTWRDIAGIAAVVLWLFALFCFSKPLRLGWRHTFIPAAAAIAAFVLIFVVFADALIYGPMEIPTRQRIPSTTTERSGGIILSLWRSVISPRDAKFYGDYNEDTMEQVLANAGAYAAGAETSAGSGENPNIIVLLSESFFDIASLENLTFETDPLANFRELCKDSVSGAFYAPTLGYGTSNIELNILTGINPELMNADENPCKWDGYMFEYIPTIPQLLSENGYYTASLHTFNDSIYQRLNYFYNVGFQDAFFSGDFAAIDDKAAAAEDYYVYLNEKISGEFYSDDYLADVIIELYEKKSEASPVFLYGLTMENHSPYTYTRNGGGFDFKTASDISDEARTTIANLAQGIHNSAAALEKLINYFSEVDEPTVIVFYGDHRPGTGLTDNSTVYTQLGLVPEDGADWTLEQVQTYYSTSYLIWANDDSLLPAERGSTMDSSANYLGLPILEASGVEMPLFWQFLKSMREDSLFYSWKYYVSADGKVSEAPDLDADAAVSDKHKLMSMLLYDTFYGKQFVTANLGRAWG